MIEFAFIILLLVLGAAVIKSLPAIAENVKDMASDLGDLFVEFWPLAAGAVFVVIFVFAERYSLAFQALVSGIVIQIAYMVFSLVFNSKDDD